MHQGDHAWGTAGGERGEDGCTCPKLVAIIQGLSKGSPVSLIAVGRKMAAMSPFLCFKFSADCFGNKISLLLFKSYSFLSSTPVRTGLTSPRIFWIEKELFLCPLSSGQETGVLLFDDGDVGKSKSDLLDESNMGSVSMFGANVVVA